MGHLHCDVSSETVEMTSRSRRFGAIALTGAFTLAACGGGESNEASSGLGSDAASELPAVRVADAVAVAPTADVATNLLPDLVVDNLNDDNKVNLRSYGVGDKPILLWMWAPH